MFKHKLFFGQGRVFSRPVGTDGKWRWWGDVSALTTGGTTEKVTHSESFSGQKGKLADFPIGGDRTLAGTLHQLDQPALVQLLNGRVSSIAGGSVTAEPLPAGLVVGDYIKLDKPYNVSALTITDSTPSTPATIPPTAYDLDAAHGSLEILSLPVGAVQPFKAAYTHAGAEQVALFANTPPNLQLRYEGINLADGGSPVIVEFYKVSTQLLQELALITSGNAVAAMPFNAEILMDTSKPANGALGQFGRFVSINPTS